jgi:hypothetical protein
MIKLIILMMAQAWRTIILYLGMCLLQPAIKTGNRAFISQIYILSQLKKNIQIHALYSKCNACVKVIISVRYTLLGKRYLH